MSSVDPSGPVHIPFDNTYRRLPETFYAPVDPTPVAAPALIQLNTQLALDLGLSPAQLSSPEGLDILSGNRVATGSQPIAMAYAGHQFGNFVRRLGDGRANLLGELVAPNGQRFDIHLKGAGRTPFSRSGDGRAALGPVLREYLLSEAMFALGVPTTRALAAVTTGQPVFRETAQPGAVFTRVAVSHLRVGSFQYFFGQQDIPGIRTLAGYAIARHYPDAAHAPRPYRAFLDAVIRRQAALVAQWMSLGFIHGVMNTDNTSISGETIDYGPCAFMEAYDPRTVFSSIDHQGRYAFSNQPHALHWNMARLTETLLPLLSEEAGGEEQGMASAYEALEQFGTHFESTRDTLMRRKLGLTTAHESDTALAEDLLARMHAHHADFTLTFRRLANAVDGSDPHQPVRSLFTDPTAFDQWEILWRQRLALESTSPAPTSPEARATQMRLTNPAFIPRNHLVQEVIEAAVDDKNFQPFHDLLAIVTHPFDDQPGHERYTLPATPDQAVTQTFCGT